MVGSGSSGTGTATYGYPYLDGSTGEEFISIRELRYRLGLSMGYVEKHTRSGDIKIVKRDGMKLCEWFETSQRLFKTARNPVWFHPTEIERRLGKRKEAREVRARLREEKRNGKSSPLETPPISPPAFVPQPELLMDPKVSTSNEFHGDMSKREAEAIKQVYLAKQAKLKYLKDIGILIEAARVKAEWEEIAIRVRKAMLSIPDRVAHLYATTHEPTVIHRNLMTEIGHALTRLQYDVEPDENIVTSLEAQTELNGSSVETQDDDDSDDDES